RKGGDRKSKSGKRPVDHKSVTPAPRHAGGVDPTHDWESAAAYADQEVAAGVLLERHKKTDEPIIQKGMDLMRAGFKGSDRTKPKERSIRRWIMGNFERCKHWWEPSKARPRH